MNFYSISNDLEHDNDPSEYTKAIYKSVQKLMQVTNLCRQSAIQLHWAYEIKAGCFSHSNFMNAVAALHHVYYFANLDNFEDALNKLK